MRDNLAIRNASNADVPEIVRLLSDDILGSTREIYTQPIAECYYQAFESITNDQNQCLLVAEFPNNSNTKLIATIQITYLANMSFQGAKRALIEGVHVDSQYRNQGIGSYLIKWAIDCAIKNNCRFVQLTSNKRRIEAHRFYERLGFVASHQGFKMDLHQLNK